MILNFRSPLSGGSRFLRIARAAVVLSVAALLLPQRTVVFEARPAATIQSVPPQIAVVQPAAPAQQTLAFSKLSGTIHDANGVPMPGVAVSLSNLANGTRQPAITNRQGAFSLPPIEAGGYLIEASMPGFAPYQSTISLQSGADSSQDITLRLASALPAQQPPAPASPPSPPAVPAPTQAPVQGPAVKLTGAIYDQSGAFIPGVTLRLTAQPTRFTVGRDITNAGIIPQPAFTGGESKETITNDGGAYVFPEVNPGRYMLTAVLPGFTTYAQLLVLQSRDTRIDAILQVARTVTQVEVTASRPSGPAASPTPPPQTPPARIGGDVAAPFLLTQTKPVYPANARAQQIQGTVQLLAVIGTDGRIASLQLDPSSSSGSIELVRAAMDAVRQWQYRPAMLNGQAIEFANTITVSFMLSD